MAGLVAEGQEVMRDGKQKEDLPADLALIAAAQKVEHYEMSAYLSARTLANQAGHSDAALLLGQSLLEEEQSDKLLSRLATILMEAQAMAGVKVREGATSKRRAEDESEEEATTASRRKRR
jgi:Mn-containing catalase